MNLSLLLVGLLKALFGIVVGAGGIFVASRALHRLLGTSGLAAGEVDAGQKNGNVAIGVLKGASLLSLGLLMQRAVVSTFTAMDLMYRDADITADAVRRIVVYASVHVGLSVIVSAAVLALGTWLFTKLTRGVDEIAEIRRGNVAPALVLAAVMVVLALMTAPGLEMALEGLIPLPELARDQVMGPA
jgi:uncharacterized membrane protein YjfL (UPF0719 family)